MSQEERSGPREAAPEVDETNLSLVDEVAEAVKAWSAEAHEQRVARWDRRRQWLREQHEQHQVARNWGLRARHAEKLRRDRDGR